MARPSIRQEVDKFCWNFEGRKIRMGVGAAYYGRTEDYRETLDHDLEILMKTYEMGFRYYDTSRSYGNSEQAVGEFIARIPRESIFLATKSQYPLRRDHDNAFQIFKDNFHQSFDRLKTDHINLFQIHDTENFDICVNEVIPFLEEKRKEGLIDYIGMGTRSINALTLGVLGGYLDSVLSYINYSLITHAADPLIEICRQQGASFVNASVLHFGAFKPEKEPGRTSFPSGKRERGRADKMTRLCEEMGIDVIHAALQYSLFNPNITMTLNGIARMSNLESTANAMRTVIHPEQWMRIAALQEEDPYFYIQDNLM